MSGIRKFLTKCFRSAPAGEGVPRAVSSRFLMDLEAVGVGGIEVMQAAVAGLWSRRTCNYIPST